MEVGSSETGSVEVGFIKTRKMGSDFFQVSALEVCTVKVAYVQFGPMQIQEDWAALRRLEKFKDLEEGPLGFCLDHTLSALVHRLHEAPKDEAIAIYIDRDENENLAREITDWHVEYNKANIGSCYRGRGVNLAFGCD